MTHKNLYIVFNLLIHVNDFKIKNTIVSFKPRTKLKQHRMPFSVRYSSTTLFHNTSFEFSHFQTIYYCCNINFSTSISPLTSLMDLEVKYYEI